ncbi:succinate dehydrogenase, cytochrome b556 subunit [Cupriavidus necator]|uniref:succinate dehydrogenase, cytochrome b556 subunit n=1 Tax=Cupriavidus necator TaxID=106590 RepID=UPI003B8A864A
MSASHYYCTAECRSEPVPEAAVSAPLQYDLAIVHTWALAHHLFAGVRHLLSDIDIGSQLTAARRSAWIVNLGGIGVAVLAPKRCCEANYNRIACVAGTASSRRLHALVHRAFSGPFHCRSTGFLSGLACLDHAAAWPRA